MKGSLRNILYILCLLGAGICIGFLIYHYVQVHKNQKIYEELQTEAKETEVPERDSESMEETLKATEIPVNFEELWQINPEIYAWIEIPGTEVVYPIVQSASDNSYYLNHTIEGYAGYPGSIYTEGINAKDFQDYNTLIYGHDMEDGSMFGGLHQFSDEEYRKSHETLLIYTPEHKLTYRIFMTVTYDDRHIMGSFDFSKKEDREAYLASIGSTDTSVTSDSKLVTLSTCIAGMPDHRFLVEAVLVDAE